MKHFASISKETRLAFTLDICLAPGTYGCKLAG